jgi:hypothetical protein
VHAVAPVWMCDIQLYTRTAVEFWNGRVRLILHVCMQRLSTSSLLGRCTPSNLLQTLPPRPVLRSSSSGRHPSSWRCSLRHRTASQPSRSVLAAPYIVHALLATFLCCGLWYRWYNREKEADAAARARRRLRSMRDPERRTPRHWGDLRRTGRPRGRAGLGRRYV